MKKKTISILFILALIGQFAFVGYRDDKMSTQKKQMPRMANMSATGACDILPTLEEHEIDVVEISEEDMNDESFCDSLEILACCVEAEAGNQDLLGKRLVCAVILNRVESPRFPDTIEGVISQKYHFTTYWDGTIDKVTPSDETFKAVQLELDERTDNKILFFTAGDYNTYCTPAYKYGDHYFGY